MGFWQNDLSGSNFVTWTVTELNAYIRQLFELDYRLQDIEVAGKSRTSPVPAPAISTSL
ncbi:MAG: hypothetical protein R3C44_15950 [Chloroflexota bacterium]